MTSCYHQPQMPWSGATGAIARCKKVSTGCGRKRRSVPAWPWICGVKPTPKAVNKPSPHSIVYGLDKPGVFTTVSESLLFFGRSEQTIDLLQQLHRTRFLAVVGSSGCGKSSLIYAGLLPKLKAGFLVEDRDQWLITTMKPGDRPLRNLAAAL